MVFFNCVTAQPKNRQCWYQYHLFACSIQKTRNCFATLGFYVIVPLGSIPELPAETCKEIKESEGGRAVSGKYWFDSLLPQKIVLAHCDMETEGQ